MTSTLKLPIHFVQQHIRQQRRQRAALRRPAAAFLDYAIDLRSRIQIRPNQPDNRPIRNPLA
ncbi:hypothetical protein D3C76_1198700 [compost metagenome]